MRAHGECGDGHMRMPVEPGNKKKSEAKKWIIQGFIAVLCHLLPGRHDLYVQASTYQGVMN
jgi:hypothetical protein